MALTRAQAVTRLAARYGRLLDEAGIVAADTPDGLGDVVDLTLLDIGVEPTALTTDPVVSDDVLAAFSHVGKAHLYDRVVPDIVMRVDASIAIPGQSKSRSQFVTALRAERDAAIKAAEAYGYGSHGSDGGFGYGVLSLDFLEPAETD